MSWSGRSSRCTHNPQGANARCKVATFWARPSFPPQIPANPPTEGRPTPRLVLSHYTPCVKLGYRLCVGLATFDREHRPDSVVRWAHRWVGVVSRSPPAKCSPAAINRAQFAPERAFDSVPRSRGGRPSVRGARRRPMGQPSAAAELRCLARARRCRYSGEANEDACCGGHTDQRRRRRGRYAQPASLRGRERVD